MLKKISSSEAWFPDGYCHYVTMSMPRRIRKFHLKNCILSLPPRLLDLETQKTEKEKKERDIIKKNAPTYVVAVVHCVLYKFLLGFASSWCSFKTTRVFFLSPSRRKAQNRRGRRRQCSDVAWWYPSLGNHWTKVPSARMPLEFHRSQFQFCSFHVNIEHDYSMNVKQRLSFNSDDTKFCWIQPILKGFIYKTTFFGGVHVDVTCRTWWCRDTTCWTFAPAAPPCVKAIFWSCTWRIHIAELRLLPQMFSHK